jgi:BlaI family transcriptional regulator, penicillinase repressor
VTVPHVTDAESAVLEALWRCGPLAPIRLIAEVKTGRDWGDATIKTLIARLMHKGAVKSERGETGLKYHPLITQKAYAASEIDRLIERVFANDTDAFATFVIQHMRTRP